MFGAGFEYVYPLAPIVLRGTTNVPAVNAVGRPSLAVGGVCVYNHFDSRRGQWSLIEIKHTTSFVHELFGNCGAFVIENLEKGAEAAIGKFFVE